MLFLDILLKCLIEPLQIARLRLQVVALLSQLSVFALLTVQILLEIGFFLQGPVPILKCLFPILHCLLQFPNGHVFDIHLRDELLPFFFRDREKDERLRIGIGLTSVSISYKGLSRKRIRIRFWDRLRLSIKSKTAGRKQ